MSEAGNTGKQEACTSPSVFVPAHIRRRRVKSPSQSAKAILPGMSFKTWSRSSVRSKEKWIDQCYKILAKQKVEVEEDKRRTPFFDSSSLSAPSSSSAMVVPPPAADADEEVEVKVDDDPPSANLRSRGTPTIAHVSAHVSVRRVAFDMWLRSSPARASS